MDQTPHKKTILVVDDEPGILSVVAEVWVAVNTRPLPPIPARWDFKNRVNSKAQWIFFCRISK